MRPEAKEFLEKNPLRLLEIAKETDEYVANRQVEERRQLPYFTSERTALQQKIRRNTCKLEDLMAFHPGNTADIAKIKKIIQEANEYLEELNGYIRTIEASLRTTSIVQSEVKKMAADYSAAAHPLSTSRQTLMPAPAAASAPEINPEEKKRAAKPKIVHPILFAVSYDLTHIFRNTPHPVQFYNDQYTNQNTPTPS